MQTETNTLTPATDFGVFNASAGRFVLPSLPFEVTALAPVTGVETVQAHLSKHHKAYVDQANTLLEPMAKTFQSALEVIAFARANEATQLLEQSSQALNHAFFWTCHQAAGLTRPDGRLEIAINEAFTDFDQFIDEATKLAKGRVGSGWLWLVAGQDGAVKLVVTIDTETMLDDPGHSVLLVCDLWEHAYYLDRTSDRVGWVRDFFCQLADWKLAESRYDATPGLEPTRA
jgi:superoxide dismutase, Fe-Mn family